MTPAHFHPQMMNNPMSAEAAWWEPAVCPEPPALYPVSRDRPQLVRVSDQWALLDGAPLGRLEMDPVTEAVFDALCELERGRPQKVLLSEWSPRLVDGQMDLVGWTDSRSVGAGAVLVTYSGCYLGQQNVFATYSF